MHNTCKLGLSDIGIDHKFSECAALQQLFNNSPNSEIWPKGLQNWHQKLTAYRSKFLKQRTEAEGLLSSAFWLHVYDNDSATREEIELYLTKFEAHPAVRDMPVKFKEEFDFLFERMKWVNSHPCAALWYVL